MRTIIDLENSIDLITTSLCELHKQIERRYEQRGELYLFLSLHPDYKDSKDAMYCAMVDFNLARKKEKADIAEKMMSYL